MDVVSIYLNTDSNQTELSRMRSKINEMFEGFGYDFGNIETRKSENLIIIQYYKKQGHRNDQFDSPVIYK